MGIIPLFNCLSKNCGKVILLIFHMYNIVFLSDHKQRKLINTKSCSLQKQRFFFQWNQIRLQYDEIRKLNVAMFSFISDKINTSHRCVYFAMRSNGFRIPGINLLIVWKDVKFARTVKSTCVQILLTPCLHAPRYTQMQKVHIYKIWTSC